MKKIYQNAETIVCELDLRVHLLAGTMRVTKGNSDINYTGSGNGNAYAPRYNSWDEWDEE